MVVLVVAEPELGLVVPHARLRIERVAIAVADERHAISSALLFTRSLLVGLEPRFGLGIVRVNPRHRHPLHDDHPSAKWMMGIVGRVPEHAVAGLERV